MKKYSEVGEFLLSELGVVGENGAKDLMEMLQYLFMYERTFTFGKHFPTLKDIFVEITKKSSEQQLCRLISIGK